MLEGAKLIGAGAATIASAGAAITSIKVFSSLISHHSVARNPSLAKQQPCLRNFGLCSNRSYCIVCRNDGLLIRLHKKKGATTSKLGSRGPFFSRGIRPAINVGLSVRRVGVKSIVSFSSASNNRRTEFLRDFSRVLTFALVVAQLNRKIDLSAEDLLNLIKEIKTYSYRFGPFLLKESADQTQRRIFALPDKPTSSLFIDVVNPLDSLIILTLASSLNALFIKQRLFAHNSFFTFGEASDAKAFSNYLETWSNIEKILLFDFARQLQKISKDDIMTKVSTLLDECPEILYLLNNFIENPILNEKGEPITEPPQPTALLISPMSEVLLNLHLIKVDRALANADFRVARLGSKVVVGIPRESEISPAQIVALVDRLDSPLYKMRVVGAGESVRCVESSDIIYCVELKMDGKVSISRK